MVSPHAYHTSGVTRLVKPNVISKVTLLNEDYICILCRFYAYKYSPVNYVKLCISTKRKHKLYSLIDMHVIFQINDI